MEPSRTACSIKVTAVTEKGFLAIGCGVLDQSGAFDARAGCNHVLRYTGDTGQETQSPQEPGCPASWRLQAPQ
eukprot:4780389-Amphidinium_carterae.1